MSLDLEGRARLFNQVRPETRAELVQTHIKRWIDAHRARLTPEQLLVMLENLGFATADHYGGKPSEDDVTRARDLAVRTMALFPPKDLIQALTFDGPPIPITAATATAPHRAMTRSR